MIKSLKAVRNSMFRRGTMKRQAGIICNTPEDVDDTPPVVLEALEMARREMAYWWQSVLTCYNQLLEEVLSLNILLKDTDRDLLESICMKIDNTTGLLCNSPFLLLGALNMSRDLLKQNESFSSILEHYKSQGGTLFSLLVAIREIDRRDIISEILDDLQRFIAKTKEQRSKSLNGSISRAIGNNRDISVAPSSSIRIPTSPTSSMVALLNNLEELFSNPYHYELPQDLSYRDHPEVINDRIVVFITHTDRDEVLAAWLAHLLHKYFNFIVFVQSDVKDMSRLDPWTLFNSLVDKVDFVVPVVTSAYLEEVQPSDHPDECENGRLDVRYIFQILRRNYTNNTCMNFKIRPAFHGVNPGMVRRHVELYASFRLWRDAPALADNLIKTKAKFKSISPERYNYSPRNLQEIIPVN